MKQDIAEEIVYHIGKRKKDFEIGLSRQYLMKVSYEENVGINIGLYDRNSKEKIVSYTVNDQYAMLQAVMNIIEIENPG
jgi:hypothetical protein